MKFDNSAKEMANTVIHLYKKLDEHIDSYKLFSVLFYSDIESLKIYKKPLIQDNYSLMPSYPGPHFIFVKNLIEWNGKGYDENIDNFLLTNMDVEGKYYISNEQYDIYDILYKVIYKMKDKSGINSIKKIRDNLSFLGFKKDDIKPLNMNIDFFNAYSCIEEKIYINNNVEKPEQLTNELSKKRL